VCWYIQIRNPLLGQIGAIAGESLK
jgi:hypothetical protein